MKSIYEIQIPVKDQEQANRLKAICLEYGLPIDELGFYFESDAKEKYFEYWDAYKEFAIWKSYSKLIESDEEEFINILKEMKNGTN